MRQAGEGGSVARSWGGELCPRGSLARTYRQVFDLSHDGRDKLRWPLLEVRAFEKPRWVQAGVIDDNLNVKIVTHHLLLRVKVERCMPSRPSEGYGTEICSTSKLTLQELVKGIINL